MASEYPNEIDEFRDVENLPGIVRDDADLKNFFAEDFHDLANAIIAIQETLGLNPEGEYETVLEWLEALQAGSGGTGHWIVDAGAPDSGEGVDGDLYLNSTNGDVYQKSSGSWGSPLMNIKGTNGTNGTNGAGVASGGTTGQKLVKASDDDFDTEWVDDGGGGGGSTIFNWGFVGNDTLNHSQTRYIPRAYFPGTGSAITPAENTSHFLIPKAGTLKNLYIKNDYNDLSNTCTVTLRKNGSDQSLVAVMSAGGGSANDTTHTVSVNAGDIISLKVVTGAGSGQVQNLLGAVELEF